MTARGVHATRLLERPVAADGPVLAELRQVALVGARRGPAAQLRHRRSSLTIAGTSSGWTGSRYLWSIATTGAPSRSRRRTRAPAA